MPDSAGGKVLDASALMAWTQGHLGMATWSSIATELGLTLLVPAHSLTEVLLARPDQRTLLDVLLGRPAAVLLDAPTVDQIDLMRDRYDRSGEFDPLASWVAALCTTRGWPALSSDPHRLQRVDPTIAIDLL